MSLRDDERDSCEGLNANAGFENNVDSVLCDYFVTVRIYD